MKKSKLVFWAFNIIVGLCAQTAFSKTIFLDKPEGVFDNRLEAAVKQRPGFYWWDGQDAYRVKFENGSAYFLTSSTMLSPIVKPVTQGYPGGRGWCEFDFFDQSYRYVNGIRVNIQDHSDTNVCNWIEGVSAVTYKSQPALLTTVQYHRGIDPAKTVDEIGNNYHRFTALLVLTPHPDGSLSIRQDDSCLGSGNQIGELATARKRIAECSQ
ncbi:hypothetical protein P0D88_37295 [Paraburkholderia sp. RL18-103-BIB-C]|jgi:hypothetical protein|uniref:hypothetical protein n=1 Tax=unclassified Paraburkholderia TaxID=2615204 RepID=UPI0038B762EF